VEENEMALKDRIGKLEHQESGGGQVVVIGPREEAETDEQYAARVEAVERTAPPHATIVKIVC
jgi:hypothetical protein